MNIVHSYINPGLKGWRKKGARIHYLKKGDVDISIIFIKSKKRTKNLFLISTGFHLEETSGPIFILDSKRIYPSLKNSRNEKSDRFKKRVCRKWDSHCKF